MKLSSVGYHVRVLNRLGLIEIVEEEQVRGSVAHFYKLVNRPLVQNTDWASLDPKVRGAASGLLLEALISDAAESLATGLFDKRPDRHLTRTPLLLDEKGWQAVITIQARAEEAVLKEQAAASTRATNGTTNIHAIVGMCCFEVLQRGTK